MASSSEAGGIVVVRRLFDGSKATGIEIIKADPRTDFTDELLNAIKDGCSMYPSVRVEGFEEYGPHVCNQSTCSPDRTCFTGIRLHIDGRNRKAIYMIGNYIPGRNVWPAAWPD